MQLVPLVPAADLAVQQEKKTQQMFQNESKHT
jgi:hypothetical protein